MNHTLESKKAAVIVLHELARDSLILTLRSKKLPNHPGEVCFPGGRWHEGDKNLYNTALRELQEELCIDSSRVELNYPMALESTLTGFIIQPWFASLENLNPYKADKREVRGVFRLPMNEVALAKNYKEIIVNRFGLDIKSYQYTATQHFVWGVTARIMMQLIADK